jgi:hypothetical protein
MENNARELCQKNPHLKNRLRAMCERQDLIRTELEKREKGE